MMWRRSFSRPGIARLAVLHPALAALAALPGARGEAQHLHLHRAAFQRARQDVAAHRRHRDRPAAHRAGIVDQQRHHGVAEFGVPFALVGQRLHRVDHHARQPAGVEHALPPDRTPRPGSAAPAAGAAAGWPAWRPRLADAATAGRAAGAAAPVRRGRTDPRPSISSSKCRVIGAIDRARRSASGRSRRGCGPPGRSSPSATAASSSDSLPSSSAASPSISSGCAPSIDFGLGLRSGPRPPADCPAGRTARRRPRRPRSGRPARPRPRPRPGPARPAACARRGRTRSGRPASRASRPARRRPSSPSVSRHRSSTRCAGCRRRLAGHLLARQQGQRRGDRQLVLARHAVVAFGLALLGQLARADWPRRRPCAARRPPRRAPAPARRRRPSPRAAPACARRARASSWWRSRSASASAAPRSLRHLGRRQRAGRQRQPRALAGQAGRPGLERHLHVGLLGDRAQRAGGGALEVLGAGVVLARGPLMSADRQAGSCWRVKPPVGISSLKQR